MTPAERKARSRALLRDKFESRIEIAEMLLRQAEAFLPHDPVGAQGCVAGSLQQLVHMRAFLLDMI